MNHKITFYTFAWIPACAGKTCETRYSSFQRKLETSYGKILMKKLLLITAFIICLTPPLTAKVTIQDIQNLQDYQFKGFANACVHRHTTPTKIWSGLLTIGCAIAAWHGQKKWRKNRNKLRHLRKYLQEHLPENKKYYRRALDAAALTITTGIVGLLSMAAFTHALGTDVKYCYAIPPGKIKNLANTVQEELDDRNAIQPLQARFNNDISSLDNFSQINSPDNFVSLLHAISTQDQDVVHIHNRASDIFSLLESIKITPDEIRDQLKDELFKNNPHLIKYLFGWHQLPPGTEWPKSFESNDTDDE